MVKFSNKISIHTMKLVILFAFFAIATISLAIMLYIRLRVIPYDIANHLPVPLWVHGIIMQKIWLMWAISSVMVVIMLLTTLLSAGEQVRAEA